MDSLENRQVLVRGLDGASFVVALDLPAAFEQRTGSHNLISEMKNIIFERTGIPAAEQVLSLAGKTLEVDAQFASLLSSLVPATVFLSLRLLGGKGGFGSLLRSQRAKKKTTNFGSSRTLDGRRVRDVERAQQLTEQGKRKAEADEVERKRKEEFAAKRQLEQDKKLNEIMAARKDAVEGVVDALEEGVKAARALKEIEKEKEQKEKKERQKKAMFGLSMMPGLEDMSFSSSNEGGSGGSSGEDVSGGDEEGESEESAKKEENEKDAKEEKPSSEPEKPIQDVEGQRGIKRALEPSADPELIDLSSFESAAALEVLGLGGLKQQLALRGMKVGGTLQERASRLFAARSKSDADPEAKRPRKE